MSFASVDDYLQTRPAAGLAYFGEVRRVVHELIENVTETIAYDLPTFRRRDKALLHLGVWSKHLALYPVPTDVPEQLTRRIDIYRTGKGTLQFRYSDPLPLDLIADIIKAREEQLAKH